MDFDQEGKNQEGQDDKSKDRHCGVVNCETKLVDVPQVNNFDAFV